MGNNKQGIFSIWLKQFSALVFTQSFQAIFMMFSLQVMAKCISNVSDITVKSDSFTANGTGYFLCSIIAYVSVTALVKMEKLIKQLFAFEDSPLLGDMSKNMRELMHSAKHLTDMGGRLKNAGQGLASAKSEAGKQRKIYDRKKAAGLFKDVVSDGSKALGGAGSVGKGLPSGKGGEIEANINASDLGKAISGALKRGDDYWADDSRFGKDGRELTEEQQQKLRMYRADQQYDMAKRNAVIQAMSTVASLGVANGASDSLEETLHTANYLDRAIMAGGKRVAAHQSNKATEKVIAKEIEDTNKQIDQIKADAVKNMRSGKSGSFSAAQAQKKSLDSYNSALADMTSTMNTKMSEEIADAAKSWADFAKTSAKTVRGEKMTSQQRKTIEKNERKFDKDDK